MPYASVNGIRQHYDVAGRGDPVLTPPAFARALARRIPGARRAVLPGAHALHIESAAAFSLTMVRFLKSVRSK